MRLLISEDIVGEVSQVLNYPRLRKIYEPEGLCREELIESVLKIVRFVRVTKPVKAVFEHPADDKFIECASAARADYIVSGDKHLLTVGYYEKTQILSVIEFLQVLETKR